MVTDAWVRQRVEEYFVFGDNNCAMTVLRILGTVFDTPVVSQVIAAAWCMPGAGGTGGLCGLVSGVLMFIGVWSETRGVPRQRLEPISQRVMTEVHTVFGSTNCRDLRSDDEGCANLAVAMLTTLIPLLETTLSTVLVVEGVEYA